MLTIVPVSFEHACQFVGRHHRHHVPPVGHKFSIGVKNDKGLCGVAIVGRPVARMRDDRFTLEVTRLCTDGTPNACSTLYAAAWRAGRAMGYRRIGTYILQSENGTSLKAAGWHIVHQTAGGSWSVPSRPREDKHPLEPKTLWEIHA